MISSEILEGLNTLFKFSNILYIIIETLPCLQIYVDRHTSYIVLYNYIYNSLYIIMYETFFIRQLIFATLSCMRKKPLTGNGALPLLPLQNAAGSQYLINWAGLYLERSKSFSRRALICTITKFNISTIIANIAKRYGTFVFISISSTFLWVMAKVSLDTLYIQDVLQFMTKIVITYS